MNETILWLKEVKERAQQDYRRALRRYFHNPNERTQSIKNAYSEILKNVVKELINEYEKLLESMEA